MTDQLTRATRGRGVLRFSLFLAAVVALAAFGLTGIVGGPERATAGPEWQGPVQPPSVRSGQALYQENCAPCHGDSGLGDGPTAAELPQGATALADPAIARAASPAEWFDIVKEGRMSLMMPPWKNRLSDQQIWDVVSYSLALHGSEAELQAGQALWDQQCAVCHGVSGAGDGPQAIAAGLAMPNLADPDLAAAQSLESWYQITSAGRGQMPAFAETLSEDEIWSALAYARNFAFPLVAATAAPTGTGQIAGQVLNGTTGAPAAGLVVTLNPFESFSELATAQTETDDAGAFRFEGLPTGSQYVYLLTVAYGGSTFGSDIVSFAAGEETLDVPLQVYETSATPGEITVNLAQWFVDSHEGALLIGELYRITHDSDRVYVGSEEVAEGRNAVLRFNVPAGATSVVFDGGEIGQRFIRTADGVVDTQPLLPGGTQILMRYLLPYSGSRAELTQSVNYPVERLSLLVVDGPDVTTNLQDAGAQTVAEQQWNSFEGANLPAGEAVSVRLAGLARAESQSAGAGATSTAVVAHNPELLYAVAALAFLAVLAVFTGYMLRRPAAAGSGQPAETLPAPATAFADPAAERARLLAAIARLDDQYAAGEIDEASYLPARAAQKRSLVLASQQMGLGERSEP